MTSSDDNIVFTHPDSVPATAAITAATNADGTVRKERRAEPPPEPAIATKLAQVTVALGILAVIALVASLYLARAFFVPLLIGILASYALRPVVDWLKACWIPRPLGAAIVLIAIIAATSWATTSLSDDATAMIEKLPEAARKVRQHIVKSGEGGQTTLQKIQEAATEIQGAATAAVDQKAPSKGPQGRSPVREADSKPSVWLRDYMLSQSALLFTVVAQTPIVVLLTFFLLASGEHFRRKLVQFVGPSLSRKKDVIRILQEVDTQIQRYMVAMLISNIVVALGTWAAFAALGLEQAAAWGLAAGVLHFIPYLGPIAFAFLSGMAGFMQFDTALAAFTVGGVSFLVATIGGSLVMPWLQSRFAKVNAAVLFIALLFFGWLWGVWGLLLGGPLVAIAKVICDRVDSLHSVGDLLGQ